MKKFSFVMVSFIMAVLLCALGLFGCVGKNADDGEAKYTVTFETFGGSIVVSQEVKAGETVQEPADPERSGYIFEGWYDNRECDGARYDFGAAVHSNMTLFAKWRQAGEDEPEPNYYTVSFDSMGGTNVSSQRIREGGLLTQPAKPTKGSDEFLGWYRSRSYDGSPYDFSTPVRESFTLYAKWGKAGVTYYTVTFETFGGSDVSAQRVEAGARAVRPANNPAREEDEFIDWFSDRDCANKFDFSSPINSDTTIYAGWRTKTDEYAVVFDVNGGQPVIDYKSVAPGEKVAMPANPTRYGYEFAGWYTDVGCLHEAQFPFTVESNAVFYAKWNDSRKCTVHFRMASGNDMSAGGVDETQNIMDDIVIDRGAKLEQPQNPKDVKYTDSQGTSRTKKFSYWSSIPYDGSVKKAVLFPIYQTDVEEMTLYAYYEVINEGDIYAKINIHPGNREKDTTVYGAQGQKLRIESLDENHPYPFYTDKAQPRNPGYRVTGYYNSENFAAENVYNIPLEFKKAENDLYVRWEKVDDVNVRYDYGYDNLFTDVKTPYNGKAERIADPIRPGYVFDGWYKTGAWWDETARWDFDNEITITNDLTLKAKWIKTASVVTFDVGGGYDITPVAVESGTEINSLPTPHRSIHGNYLYSFQGWYFDDEFTDEVTFPFTVDDDMTLYAQWDRGADISKFEFYQSGGNNVYYYVTVKNSERENISGSVTIPERFNGGYVGILSSGAFRDCVNVTEVLMSDKLGYIRENAFQNCTNLRKVRFGNNVYQICWDAFKNCPALEDVNFPNGGKLDSINASIFRYCPKMWDQLEKVSVGSSYVYYWGTAFLGNGYYVAGEGEEAAKDKWVDGITELTIRDGTTVVATYAMANMRKLETLTFADSVVWVTGNAFPEYKKGTLKTLHLGKSFREVSDLTTKWPETVTTLTVSPDNPYYEVTQEGNLVDNRNHKLLFATANATEITDGVEIIGSYAFCNRPFETIVIPDSVYAIYEYAFRDCGLKTVNIPDSVGMLDQYSFYSCEEMQSITFGKNTPRVARNFFYYMDKLEELNVSEESPQMMAIDSVLYDKVNEDIIFAAPKYAGEVHIWDKVKRIPEHVFAEAYYPAMYLPDSVEEIDEGAFFGMEFGELHIGAGLKDTEVSTSNLFDLWRWPLDKTPVGKVEVSPNNPYLTVVDGILYSHDMTTMLLVESGKDEVIIPDSVTHIDAGLMLGKLSRLHVGNGVPFQEIFDLLYGTEDGLGAGVTADSVTASNNAAISIKDGVVYTGDKKRLVYFPCSFNGDLELPKEMVEVNDCIPLMTCDYIDDGEVSDDYINSLVLENLTVEEGSELEKIGDFAFAALGTLGCIWDVEFELPYWQGDKVWMLVEDFIYEIHHVDLSNAKNLKYIGYEAFAQLMTLETIVLPDSVEEYGFAALSFLYGLQSLTGGNLGKAKGNGLIIDVVENLCNEEGYFAVDDALIGIDTSYFAGTEIWNVPENIVSLRSGSFWFAPFKEIVLPDNLKTIENGVFTTCRNLQSLTIPAGVTVLKAETINQFCSAFTEITIKPTMERIEAFCLSKTLSKINFEGTTDQWLSIEKTEDWDAAFEDYTVYCQNGTIDKNGVVTNG